ncbi:MAG: Glycogen synthase [Parcubacteria group bacterium GW2011_GWE2_39_37]|uniref:Glycogen synthase n=1 Tax=Candidatus Falkowbacteria bacterium GW2011_GWF2_39_8 TaxID=1618642 RepID=A0A0G0Q0Z0_9BACT|nr:MAG: Glycogen synthase [Parcubacteria group bacterium GW2011_GWE2_39_37]KKR33798.1 MAG: Glycogen synthase [Candidatus Falkowbacteria bacterium GW2011_GWF2_39_8]
MVAAELTPIAKAGGLGDVIGALPKALADLGCEVKIILPYYGFINDKTYKIKKIIDKVSFISEGVRQSISLWETILPGSSVKIILIKHRYFSGKNIYEGGRVQLDKKYTRMPNDIKRFAFFSHASLEAVKSLDWQPDVIHCHDWHVAVITDYLKGLYQNDPFFQNVKTLYTIHNLANQGIAEQNVTDLAKLSSLLPSIKKDLEDGQLNFMQQGIANGNLINTVSPTYAKEILTKEYGAGLEKLLKTRKNDLSGIINGIDVDFFNPQKDKFIKYNYSSGSLQKKKLNKLYLQKELGLEQDQNKLMIGLVSRLVWQKGIELVTEKFADLDCQFVFLGTGQKETEEHLLTLAKKFPGKFSAQIKFDVGLAQRIYAGADMFLMPSLFEPCGLGQLIAMRYGTVPVVRTTGGLADTVDSSVGFSFSKFNSNVLYETLSKAIDLYHSQPKAWNKLIQKGMKKDFSWHKSAKEYIKLYNKLAKIK